MNEPGQSNSIHTTVNAGIFVGDLFLCAQIPTKIKPMKICAHVELATVITAGYPYPRKVIPMKI